MLLIYEYAPVCVVLTPYQVDSTKLPCLAQWKRDYTMETILLELRR
jgi:ubiquitin-conjugating enzyme E2 variant